MIPSLKSRRYLCSYETNCRISAFCTLNGGECAHTTIYSRSRVYMHKLSKKYPQQNSASLKITRVRDVYREYNFKYLTIREVAYITGYSSSSVHEYIKYLEDLDIDSYKKIRELIEYNTSERAKRGGLTKKRGE